MRSKFFINLLCEYLSKISLFTTTNIFTITKFISSVTDIVENYL